MPDYLTARGFAMYCDLPTGEGNFTVQESSAVLAGDVPGPFVWIGLEDERAHLTVEQAVRVRDALSEFIATDDIKPERAILLAALRSAHEGDYDFDPEYDYGPDDSRYLDAIERICGSVTPPASDTAND